MKEYCHTLKVGDKIKFKSEKQRYTVMAKSWRFLICTKPLNCRKTVLYTIIDLDRLERGPNNLIFNLYDYMVQKDIDECLKDLMAGKTELSYRRSIPLDIATMCCAKCGHEKKWRIRTNVRYNSYCELLTEKDNTGANLLYLIKKNERKNGVLEKCPLERKENG